MNGRAMFGDRRQRGMTLVELMVAVLLGLVTTFFIAQVMFVSEGYKRTTSTGSDAQVSGALALYTLQRDVQAAGYGIASVQAALGCPVSGTFGTAGSTTTASFTLAPVVITPGATASAPSDALTVLSSAKAGFSAPIDVTEVHPASSNYFAVRSSFGVAVGDVMVAAPAAWTTTNGCTMFSVEQDTSIADTTLSATRVPHVPGGNASWNKDLPSIFPSSGYTDSSILLNLGGIAKRKYAVSTDGTLEIESLTSTGAAPTTQNMYSQIVLLKALYGRDTNNDNVIDTYDANTPTTAAGWAQVRAVRVAIVARSAQREKDVVSTTPAWNVSTGAAVSYVDAASGSTTACAAAAATCSLPLTVNHLTDWAHYRYKVYDTVIPLRNVLWNS